MRKLRVLQYNTQKNVVWIAFKNYFDKILKTAFWGRRCIHAYFVQARYLDVSFYIFHLYSLFPLRIILVLGVNLLIDA